jgi:hypothetical protein
MGKFQLGDIVEVIKDYPPEECPDRSYLGEVYTIVAQTFAIHDISGRAAFINVVDERASVPGHMVGFEDEYLRKVDDGDCYEKTEWDESIFKPRELVRIEND